MNVPDLVNTAYECGGGYFVGLNAWDIWKKKSVAGQTLPTMLFFSSWGVANLFVYPSVHLFWSTAGAAVTLLANIVMIALILKYRKPRNGP